MTIASAQLLRELRGGTPAQQRAAAALQAQLAPRATEPKREREAADEPQMNGWETEYGELLERRKQAGEVLWYGFGMIRLRIGKGCMYKPDYFVVLSSGVVECHEVKGFMREAARVRLRVAAERYPFRFVVCRKVDGEWRFEDVK